MRRTLTAVFLCCAAAAADGPYEHRWVKRSEIPDSVLVQTIAVASLERKGLSDSLVPLFLPTGSGFAMDGLLNLARSTPLSSYGYHSDGPALNDGVWRFPVTDISRGHVSIVVDPRTGRHAWIAWPQSGGGWDAGLVLFGSLPGHPRWLDPFFLAQSDSVPVFDEPGGKPGRYIRMGNRPGAIRAVWQRGDFVYVQAVAEEPEVPGRITPIGWIRVRDEQGRLLLWLYSFDNC